MIKPRRFAPVLGALLTIGLLAAACGSNNNNATPANGPDTVSRANKDVVESNNAKPVVGGKLVYALNNETNGWNPAVNEWAPSGLIVSHAIFDTITAFDDHSEIKPYLAESFTSNPEFTKWTFKLRPGVTFSNGKPANADAVVRAEKYIMNSAVVGSAFKYAKVTTIDKVDDLTFSVSMEKPFAMFPIAFASQLGVVADPDWLETNDSLLPIGTGPFILDKWEIGNKLTVKKNPNYWQTDTKNNIKLPYLDSIEFRTITDITARGQALQAKDVDVIQTFTGQQVLDMQSVEGVQIYSDDKGESRETMVMLNTTKAPFTDIDARMALAYATNKEEYVQTMNGGFDEVANGPFSKNSPWYTPTDYPQYDPVKAKDLVEKVKAKNGGKFEFTIIGFADSETQAGIQILQTQYKAVGIDMTIDMQEEAKAIIQVVTGGYTASLWSQFDLPNPYGDGLWWDSSIVVPPPTITLNFARNKDDAIGAALETGRASGDPAVQKKQMGIVQQRLAADIPYVWINHLHQSLIASKRVVNLINWKLPDGTKGLEQTQGGHPLSQVWMQPA